MNTTFLSGRLVAALLMFSSLAASSPARGELVAHWTFNNTFADSTVNGNDGIGRNDPSFAPGVLGDAVDFNGTNQSVGVASMSTSSANTFTISAWVYARVISGSPIIWRPDGGFTAAFYPWDGGGSPGQQRLVSNVNSTLGGQQANTPQGSIAANTWFLATWTYNGPGGQSRLFIDGVQQVQVGAGSSLVPMQPASIGGRWDNSAFLNGLMDDMAIWNRPLTPGNVAALYNLGTASLKYDAGNLEQLIQAHATQTPTTIDGLTWNYTTTVTGSAGSLVQDGSAWTLNLDGSSGMVAVPEPASVMLLATAVAMLGISTRRRRAKPADPITTLAIVQAV